VHSLCGTNGEMIVNYGLDELWREVVVVYFNVMFQNVPGHTDENCLHPQLGLLG
jgi:hypothetical protein